MSASTSALSQPISRSRTLLFLSYRDSRARVQDSRFHRHYDGPEAETEGLIPKHSGDVVLDMQETLPPKWYEEGCLYVDKAYPKDL